MLAFFIFVYDVKGQSNFRVGWEKNNPVALGSTLAFEEKVKVHQSMLDKATLNKDTLRQLHSLLYLFYDYLRANDYPTATRYLLEAENIANTSGNPGWQGWVMHRKGVLAVNLENYKGAIPSYESALALCTSAHDSLCMGETLEQLSAMHTRIYDFEKAHHYFNLALPLLEKYGTQLVLATALNNYANLLSTEGDPNNAIPYLKRALEIIRKAGDKRKESIYLNNLASAYRQLKKYDEALAMFNQCVRINLENNWPENLITNYSGISIIYENTGDFQQAFSYLQKYHALRDSIIGIEMQGTIADLEAKYKSQQQELELQKSKVALGLSQSRLERGALLFLFSMLLAAFGFWRWRKQTHQSKREQLKNKENLKTLTSILLEKNTQIIALETQISARLPDNFATQSVDFEENLYNQRILTDADWSEFKIYYEKAYPGYLQRLRTAFPALTDAEERLFLFIKLNLTTKEAATILGISADSVKKTRYRLRKRLELDEATDLDAYIRNF